MSTPALGLGVFSAIVWPVYVGFATGDPGPGPVPLHEPFGDINYQRGAIEWHRQPDGDVLGVVEVFVPKGIYTWAIFLIGDNAWGMNGKAPLTQPQIFDRPGVITMAPIRNRELLPRQPF